MANRLAEYEKVHLPQGAYWPQSSRGNPGLQKQMQSWMNVATNWVIEHPEIALTTALITGAVLGWLIKRR